MINIIETNIPDIGIENIDSTKLDLAESIIEGIQPLLDLAVTTNNEKTLNFDKLIGKTLEIINTKKEKIQMYLSEYKLLQKRKKLLHRIDNMVDSGLLHEASLKHEIIILLKIIDKLGEEKLDKHLQKTDKIIKSRLR